MAIDFGIYTALRGAASAGDRGEQRKQHYQMIDNMYKQYQYKQEMDMKYEMQAADYIDQVNEIANQAVIRPQDQEYIQGLADNMMLEISENVKGYGGYSKFMLSGGWKQIRDYKKTMLESEEFARLKTNAANYTKLQELKDENPHQIYQKDLNNFEAYFAGATDHLTYSGAKGVIDVSAIAENVPKGVQLTPEHILSDDQNYSVLSTNMAIEMNANRSNFTAEEWNYALEQYILEQPEYANDRQIKYTGTGEPIPFDVGADMRIHLDGLNYSVLGDDMRGIIASDRGINLTTMYGSDVSEAELRNYTNAARIMNNKTIEDGWGKLIFGDNWRGMNNEISVNLQTSGRQIYDEDGHLIGSDASPLSSNTFIKGATGTAAAAYAGSAFGPIGTAVGAVLGTGLSVGLGVSDALRYDEVEDLTPTGIYMVQKISFKDKDGNTTSMLLPNLETVNKLQSEFGDNYTVENVFAMRMAYDRLGKFDDDLMMELPTDSVSLGNLSKLVDINDSMNTQRDAEITFDQTVGPVERRNEQINMLNQQIAGDYSDAMEGRDYNAFYSHAMPRLSMIVAQHELPANSYNPLMALNLELSKGQGAGAFDQSVMNFGNIVNIPGGQDLMNALKVNDMYSFFNILQTSFGFDKTQSNRVRNTMKNLALTQEYR
jgi:hypothetical protein